MIFMSCPIGLTELAFLCLRCFEPEASNLMSDIAENVLQLTVRVSAEHQW
jgi:hypothetical protein